MIGAIAALTIKELRVLWHDRPALALLFAMPAFFILIMSYALQNVFEAGTAARPIAVLVVNGDHGPLAEQVRGELAVFAGVAVTAAHGGRPLTLPEAEDLVRGGAYAAAIVFPSDFSGRLLADGTHEQGSALASLVVDPATNQQLIAPLRGLLGACIERTAWRARLPARVRAALVAAAGARAPGIELGPELLDEIERGLAEKIDAARGAPVLDTAFPSGTRSTRKPSATEQSVPAYTIFGVFFIALTLAASVMRERTDGTAVRLLAAPLPRGVLLAGKLLPFYLVNLLQMAVMFAVGVAAFGIHLGDLRALAVVALALAAAATALGLLIAALCRTEAQVGALAVLCSIALAALGGLLVPTFVMPPALRTLAYCTPHGWALTAFHDVMLRGLGTQAVLPEVGVLLGFAASCFGVAVWRLRWT